MRIREERLRGALQVTVLAVAGEGFVTVVSLLSFPFRSISTQAVSTTTSRGGDGLSASVGLSWQSSRDALIRFHEVGLSLKIGSSSSLFYHGDPTLPCSTV